MTAPQETVPIIPEGQLAYGMQLPTVALSTMVAAPWEHGAGTDALLAAAQAADRAGFFYVAVCDHIVIPRDRAETMSTTWFHPVATLAWVAAQTERVNLLTNVFVPAYRHPLESAKMFSTLDALSGGRVILGVGAGHVEGEFEALGLDFSRRGQETNDAIDAIVEAWLHEYVGEVGARPRPVRQPRPPIWVGGSSAPAMRRVAERGDGWIPQGTPRKKMPESIAYILGRRDEVRPGAHLELGVITEAIHVGTPREEQPRWVLHGEPERIAESLNEYGDMGVSHLQIRFVAADCAELVDQMERFGAEVGPLLRRPVTR